MLPIATPGVIKFIAVKGAGCGSRLVLLKEEWCLTMLIGEHHQVPFPIYKIIIFTKGFWASTECNGEESEF